MSHLLLAHLSNNNNTPEIVQTLFNAHAGNVKITVASRFSETEVFHIFSEERTERTSQIKRFTKTAPTQLSFGFV